MKTCSACRNKNSQIKRPKTSEYLCKECFFDVFENEVHETIMSNHLFQKGDKVAIGASGGKDSTVLAYLMKLLNDRHQYGIDLFLLSIDEGIKGYRDDSLESVKRNQEKYQLPLKIVSYKELYGWTMDEVVQAIGKKNNCTFCGVFRRQALDRGCQFLKVDKLLTGHNADDIAETILMNLLRGDIPRLERCVRIVTCDLPEDMDHNVGSEFEAELEQQTVPRAKPFKYTYQKEIVMYAHFKKLDYFSTECTYSPQAYRGNARDLIKDLEKVNPMSILNIILTAEEFQFAEAAAASTTSLGDIVIDAEDIDRKKKNNDNDNDILVHLVEDIETISVLDEQRTFGSKRIMKKKLNPKEQIQSNIMANSHHFGLQNISHHQELSHCIQCGYISSQKLCRACEFLEGLNSKKAKISINFKHSIQESKAEIIDKDGKLQL